MSDEEKLDRLIEGILNALLHYDLSGEWDHGLRIKEAHPSAYMRTIDLMGEALVDALESIGEGYH